ncbi:violacein biosynthesis protein VioB [Streptococcus sanguinis]|uniref:Violacein biosynthesis protein VioB n=1 Tax=Streptococcus sanguinis TaxID=1305 RepID=A0A7H8UXM5_STRSA|nr:violacein biosynthesis protein VioB [Streptococcus sanguinis]
MGEVLALSADGRLLIGKDWPRWMIQAYWSKRNLGDASWPREMDGSALQNAVAVWFEKAC